MTDTDHHGPEYVALDRCRWRGDTGLVLLTDGSELEVRVAYYDDEPCVVFECVVDPGAEITDGRSAEPWVAAHEPYLRRSWDDHCRDER